MRESVAGAARFAHTLSRASMGLTIHYDWSHPLRIGDARALVEQWYAVARDMSCFDAITPVQEVRLAEEQAESAVDPGGVALDELRHLRLDGTVYLERADETGQTLIVPVEPLHVIQFSVRTDGAETAVIGLASHPAEVEHHHDDRCTVVHTGLSGCFSWHSFCKTQYAGLPNHGGPDNFIRSHVGLVALLDHIGQSLGGDLNVRDDSGYWESRDVDELRAELERWNGLIAAVAGVFKDALGDAQRDGLIAPILRHPNFEHLEARGRDRLAD